MSASLTFTGLQDLKAALRDLPAALKGEATAIVLDAAHAAAADIRDQYPVGPGQMRNGVWYPGGNLKKGVKVLVKEIGPFGVATQVRSAAEHGWIWEFGTEARHYFTGKGTRHETGRMWGKRPRTPVFIPTMIRHRRALFRRLAALLAAHGLATTLDEAA